MRRPCSGRSSCVGLLLAAVCLVGTTPSPALAHTSLAASTPPEGSTVAQPLDVVQLVFTSAVSTAPAQLVLTAPDGTELAQGSTRVSGATVSRPVGAWPVAGSYRLAYRVLAEDGHPITGQVSFRVDPSAAPAAVPAAPSAAPGANSAGAAAVAQVSADRDGRWLVPALAAGLGAAGLALGVGMVRSARRSAGST